MADLLQAAQLNLAEDATAYLEGTSDYYQADYRRFGAVILFFITYDNAAHYFGQKPAILYYYRPQLVTSVDDYTYESVYSAYPYNRTFIYKKGIRIIGVLDGQIGVFTFQTLLVQLTTSLALLKIAATVVDLIAVSVLPERSRYRKAKYEKTETFNLRSSLSRSADSLRNSSDSVVRRVRELSVEIPETPSTIDTPTLASPVSPSSDIDSSVG